MPPPPSLGLFEAYGIELEYMIVDRNTLSVKPIVDVLFHRVLGSYESDVERGDIVWSNELVNHVVELKTNGPVPTLSQPLDAFRANVEELNTLLAAYDACLLPTGAHPLMDPLSETMLWPHEFGEVYRLYDRIFDCRGHGWSNLQSVHLNLPFSSEDEFGRLHAAVRLLLPILPALSASTPLFDGAYTGFSDSRLEVYRKNQSRIPAIAGRVIPEAVFTRTAYDASIYAPIEAGIRPHDPAGILKSTFMNSRGAIARFDRNTIEIRIIDSQECPTAELAILAAVVAVARAMVEERWVSIEVQKAWEVEPLAGHFLRVIREGEAALLPDPAYLSIFGYPGERASAGQLWRHLIEAIRGDLEPVFVRPLGQILEMGCLSTRIRRRLGDRPSPKAIRTVYEDLARCLAEDRLFA